MEPIDMLTAAALPADTIAPTDEELIQRTLSGDREAFGNLAQRYEAPLFRHLRRLVKSREDAEELAQEALLRAYRALPEFRRHVAFGPWLFCIATNLARDAARRTGKRVYADPDELETLPDERIVNARDRLHLQREAHRLEQAVLQLPSTLQAMLNLYYREGLKLTQVAEALGQDVGAIRVAVHRARIKLRNMLVADEGTNDHE